MKKTTLPADPRALKIDESDRKILNDILFFTSLKGDWYKFMTVSYLIKEPVPRVSTCKEISLQYENLAIWMEKRRKWNF